MKSPIGRLTPIKPQSKKQLVYDMLLKNIISGAFPPGSRLVISTLAGHLGVSQIPVREALQQLEADGFISIRPHAGAHVTEIHESLIYEIFGMLAVAESISLGSACPLLTQDDLDHIEGLLKRMDTELDDPEEFSRSNVEFHMFICERAQTPLIRSMLPSILDHWDRLRRHFLDDVYARRIHKAQQGHRELFDALRNKDTDRVITLAREHNQAACASYADFLGLDGPVCDQA